MDRRTDRQDHGVFAPRNLGARRYPGKSSLSQTRPRVYFVGAFSVAAPIDIEFTRNASFGRSHDLINEGASNDSRSGSCPIRTFA